jgi:hypothetical protein
MEVELPMILEVYNKCAVEFMKGWSVSSEIQHIKVEQYFLYVVS